MRPVLISFAVLALAVPAPSATAWAQFARRPAANPLAGPPPGTPPADAEIWPFPLPDPKSWWDDPRPKAPEAADPLGGRRLPAQGIDNGIDPSTYRLWGLPPLQWQALRGEEMILEVWIRPSGGVRQSVVRIVVRRDGKAFVSARAGLACCEAGIGRRVGFDAELPAGAAATFLPLRSHPMWNAARTVRLNEGPGLASTLCVDGVDYDLTLVVPGRSRTLHRACADAEIGQVADALQPAIAAALGHDGRFDVLFPRGADFSGPRAAYAALLKAGRALTPDPEARPQPKDRPTEQDGPPG